ncbi:MAG: hypothetical protein JSS43_29745 [Proteobacteria bacterium]|nr:hypothetical protein [Pseudomonadota bacterium]
MPVIVTRLYDSEDKARQVESELAPHTLSGQVTVVTQADGDSARQALAANGMSNASAKAYAEAVSQGRSAVSVAPSFGYAGRVTRIMDAAGPVDTHIVDVPDEDLGRSGSASATARVEDPAAPVSARFGWPVLLDDPAPASRKFGWRVLLDDPAPLSRLLGWRTLSANQDARASLSPDPAPLSRRLGWRLLLNDPTPVSDRFGWRVLKDDPTPASTKFGWRTLSENQQPRTSLLHDPAPLSRLLGLPVLLRSR